MPRLVKRKGFSENSHVSLEIMDGKFDLIVYNDSGDNFVTFRNDSDNILTSKLDRSTCVVGEENINKFLATHNLSYDKVKSDIIERIKGGK